MKKTHHTLPNDAKAVQAPPGYRPIMATRQNIGKYFDGLNAQTLANLAAQGKGPRFWRKGKFAWYDISEAENYLKKNPITTSEEDST